jgi:hypothetical protein
MHADGQRAHALDCDPMSVAVRQKPEAATMTESPLTISVPEAGRKYFGMSRDASYIAARRGEIPTIRIGRLLKVPIRALEKMLDSVEPKSAA